MGCVYNKIKRVIAASCLGGLLLSACTKNFESINENPYDFNEDELTPDLKLLGEPLI